LAGDLDAAARYGAMLLGHTERHPVRLRHLWACGFSGTVMVKRGEIAGGLNVLRGELEQAGEAKFLPRFLLPLGELAAALGEAGEVTQGTVLHGYLYYISNAYNNLRSRGLSPKNW